MKEGGGARGVREGAYIGGATMLQPWTLRLTRNAAALAAASPTLLFFGGSLFITAVPNTKLCSWGEEDSGGHVL